MKMFITLSAITLAVGSVVKLSEKQVNARKHCIKPVDAKKGIYELTEKTQFKTGETFGYEGELPKTLARFVEEESKAKKTSNKKQDKTPEPEQQPAELPVGDEVTIDNELLKDE